jgi:predicted permease
MRLSYPDYLYLRDHARSFDSLMGSTAITAGLGLGASSRAIWGEAVTGNYFDVLGVRASHGRLLQPSDTRQPGQGAVVVISDALWRSDFAADPDVVGKTIVLDRYPLTIVGVTDASFHGSIVGYEVEAFVPITIAPMLGVTFGSRMKSAGAILSDVNAGVVFPHGRLAAGVSLANATSETNALWTALAADRPRADTTPTLNVVRFWESPTGGQTFLLPSLTVMAAMGLLVLAIACANIAGLVVVRGVSRRGEIAMRLALGATRARIVRLLIIENLVLAVPGAIIGAALASRGLPFLVQYAQWMAAPQRLFFNIRLDAGVMAFAVIIGCGSAVLFGFLPALQSARVDLVSVMNEATPRGTSRGRFRAALVVAQVAVSLLLLIGAGLVTRSFEAARAVSPGVDASHVAAVSIDIRQAGYDEARGRVFYRQLLENSRADAGVEAASLAAFPPLALIPTPSQRVAIDGYAAGGDEDMTFMSNAVSAQYFDTLRIPLAAGRAFEDRDDEHAAPVAIVNVTFADRFLGGSGHAVGRRFRAGESEWTTIVGVAADVKYMRINEAPRPYYYVPFPQGYRTAMTLLTRGDGPIDARVLQARAHVQALEANLPVFFARPLAERFASSLVFFSFTALVLFIFGAAGMVLAALGTYGLVSYTVSQSTREIGIRMALGAPTLAVVRAFVSRGLRLGVLGVGVGLVAAFGLTRLLQSALYGVSATDAISFGVALAIVLGGVLIATLLPAWRASRTDPLQALRRL